MHKISGKTYKKIMCAVSFLACLMLAGEALLIHMKDERQGTGSYEDKHKGKNDPCHTAVCNQGNKKDGAKDPGIAYGFRI